MTDPNLRQIADREVHVWVASLDELDGGALFGGRRSDHILSPDERSRAARRVREMDRRRWSASHALLRAVIANYVSGDPAAIVFDYEAQGRPRLAANPVRFNLSDSGGMGVVAITKAAEVGVDIERIHDDCECLDIARRHFRPEEVALLEKLSVVEQTRHFFDLWTRKEARLKATGQGIAGGLDCEVGDVPGWTIVGLDLAPGFAAAVAVMDEGCRPVIVRP